MYNYVVIACNCTWAWLILHSLHSKWSKSLANASSISSSSHWYLDHMMALAGIKEVFQDSQAFEVDHGGKWEGSSSKGVLFAWVNKAKLEEFHIQKLPTETFQTSPINDAERFATALPAFDLKWPPDELFRELGFLERALFWRLPAKLWFLAKPAEMGCVLSPPPSLTPLFTVERIPNERLLLLAL